VLTSIVVADVVVMTGVETIVVVTTLGFSVVAVVLVTETSPCDFRFQIYLPINDKGTPNWDK
jgi:hypothetical protein